MLKLKLTSGEEITGTPNYATATAVEIRLPDGSFRDLKRAEIETVTRPKRGA